MAGTITATPSPVEAGNFLEVCVTDSANAGEIVTVTMDNGEGAQDEYDLSLDANGYGCFSWEVPVSGWDVVQINSRNCPQETVFVN